MDADGGLILGAEHVPCAIYRESVLVLERHALLGSGAAIPQVAPTLRSS